MCGAALGCGFINRCRRGSAPGSRPAIERAGVHPNPADDTRINPGAFAAEAGGHLQAGSRPFARADRDANAETVADVGASPPALAVAALLGVAVGRRRPAPPQAYPPLLAAAIPQRIVSIPHDP
jgi:hypothetical protein